LRWARRTPAGRKKKALMCWKERGHPIRHARKNGGHRVGEAWLRGTR